MKGKSWPNIMHSKDDGTVTSLNNLTDDITILSNDNANIQVTTEGQAIKIDSSQVSANKADIIANFPKYYNGYLNNGQHQTIDNLDTIDHNSTYNFNGESCVGTPFFQWGFCTTYIHTGYSPTSRWATQVAYNMQSPAGVYTRYMNSMTEQTWSVWTGTVSRNDDGGISVVNVVASSPYPLVGTNGLRGRNLHFPKDNGNPALMVHGDGSDWLGQLASIACAGYGDGTNVPVAQVPVTNGAGQFNWKTFSSGLKVGDLIWNDTTTKAMSSNMMPATGIYYLDPVIFPELFEKIGYTNGRKGDLFKVGIDTTYPYLSMVKSGRGVGSTETDAIRNITGTNPVGAFQNRTSTGCFYNNGKQSGSSAEGGNKFFGIDFSLSRGLSGGSSHIQSTIHPANTACYLNRVASTGQNEALEQALKDTPLLTVRCIATKDNLEGFVENELMGEIEVPFNYHTTQWHWVDEKIKDSIIIDKVEYWISESQTKVEPLETKKGFTQLFKNDKFEYKEDHRKEVVYLKTDGSSFTITELGKIPNEYTTIVPPNTYVQYYKFNTNKWILDSSKKETLIINVSTKVKSQTENNISTGYG